MWFHIGLASETIHKIHQPARCLFLLGKKMESINIGWPFGIASIPIGSQFLPIHCWCRSWPIYDILEELRYIFVSVNPRTFGCLRSWNRCIILLTTEGPSRYLKISNVCWGSLLNHPWKFHQSHLNIPKPNMTSTDTHPCTTIENIIDLTH